MADDCLAADRGDPRVTAAASILKASALLARGEERTAAQFASAARRENLAASDLFTATRIAIVSARLAFRSGAYGQAISQSDLAMALSDRTDNAQLRAVSRRTAAAIRGHLRIGGQQRIANEFLAFAIKTGRPGLEADAYNTVANIWLWSGNLSEARRHTDTGLAVLVGDGVRHQYVTALLYSTSGEISLAAGEPEQALTDLDHALELLAERALDPQPMAEVALARIQALIALGRIAEARTNATEILDWLGERVPQSRRRIMEALADALRRSGEPAHAYDMLRSASDLQQHEFNQLRDQLHDQAETDWLTGVGNRKCLDNRLAELAAGGHSAASVFVDIDDFKGINDRFGHHIGDEVLMLLADLIGSEASDQDLVVRTGGDEFLLLITGSRVNGAAEVAERLRQSVLKYGWRDISPELQVTISAGVAAVAAVGQTGELLQLAGRGLSSAKQAGRNQVQAVSPDSEPAHLQLRQAS
ncbi:MAG: diguanylate cyclase [Solirubrobacterales bacterium]|nr:diguanylate cyclase [Solirubrobacterales bacterium]